MGRIDKKRRGPRRNQTKHPALKPEYNTRARRYFIETEYVDGVYDKEGNCVIRPLTEEEKDFLNKFYSETLVTSFQKDGSDFYSDPEDRKRLYRENNHRNVCLFNYAQRTNQLSKFNAETYDEITSDRAYGIFSPEELYIALLDGKGREWGDDW